MGKTFEEIGDEAIERIYGLKAVRRSGKVLLMKSPEDIARKQAIREQQIRNDIRNESLDAEEEREKAEKANRDNRKIVFKNCDHMDIKYNEKNLARTERARESFWSVLKMNFIQYTRNVNLFHSSLIINIRLF